MAYKLPDELKEQAANLAIITENMITRAVPSDKVKVATIRLSELPEDLKAFFLEMCNVLFKKYSMFKGCKSPDSYQERGGLNQLHEDLKAVCKKMDFPYSWAREFILMHGTPDKGGKTWVFGSGQRIQNPIAVFTNWCVKYKQHENKFVP